ncbi:unnamed protein product [Phytomonas sp. EM1]|nr:unnamed protein product [Phytomonas sp. EM1]|eukprot:CCW65211.1 unnamed protein product [Phytomonas sp. isolate EM1]
MRHAVNTLLSNSLETESDIHQGEECVVFDLQNIGSITASDLLLNHDKKKSVHTGANHSFGRANSLQSFQGNWINDHREGKQLELAEIPTTTTDSSLSRSVSTTEDDCTHKDRQPFLNAATSAGSSCEKGVSSLSNLPLFVRMNDSMIKASESDMIQGITSIVGENEASSDGGHDEVCDMRNMPLSLIVDEVSSQSIDEPSQTTSGEDAKETMEQQEDNVEESHEVRSPNPTPKFLFVESSHDQSGVAEEQKMNTDNGNTSLISPLKSPCIKSGNPATKRDAIAAHVKSRRAHFELPVILRCAEEKGRTLERAPPKSQSTSSEPALSPSHLDASRGHARLIEGSEVSVATTPPESGRSITQLKPDRSRCLNALHQPKVALVWAPDTAVETLRPSGVFRTPLPPLSVDRSRGKHNHTPVVGSTSFLDDARDRSEFAKALFHDKAASSARSGDTSRNGDASPASRESSVRSRDPQKVGDRELQAGVDSEFPSTEKAPWAGASSTTVEKFTDPGGNSPTTRGKAIHAALEALRAIRDSHCGQGVCEAGDSLDSFSLLERIEDFLHRQEAVNFAAEMDESTTIYWAGSPLEVDKASERSILKAEVVPNVDEFDELTYSQDAYPQLRLKFHYGKPTVFGRTTPFFKEGALYKILTSSQEYHFFNDTLDSVMLVRAECVLSGEERVNDQAVVTPLENRKEVEIAISVLPEQTVFLLSVEQDAPHLVAKAVPAPDSIVAPSMKTYLDAVSAQINRVRELLGQWNCITNQEAYLKCCLKNQIGFVDLDFKPAAVSLIRPGVDLLKLPPVIWQRPSGYVALSELAEVRLFRGEIAPDLVRQGALQDHAVVAAIAAIAQRARHVVWMFRHPASAERGKKERAVGCYRVMLLRDGWWGSLLLDDYFPASAQGPLFARCPVDPRRIWVGMLEKAYAKSIGSYAAICQVDVMDVLSDFTGFPARPITWLWRAAMVNPNGGLSGQLFEFLSRCVSDGHFVLLHTPGANEEEEEGWQEGREGRGGGTTPFLPAHVYFLTGCAFYEELALRVVRIRNVWRYETTPHPTDGGIPTAGKYTNWCEEFDLHEAEAPADEGGVSPPSSEASAPGTIFLEWGEALRTFSGGGVCYGLWDFSQYRIRNHFTPQGFPAFALEVNTAIAIDIFMMLTMEGAAPEAVNEDGGLRAGDAEPHGVDALDGVSLVITTRSEEEGTDSVLCRACSELGCVVDSPVFETSCNLCVKAKLEPKYNPYYIVPQLDPEKNTALRRSSSPAEQLRFVLSIFSSRPVHPGVFDINFQEILSSCEVFSADPPSSFHVNPSRVVKTTYQCPSDRGVDIMERTCITPQGY